MSNTVKPDSSSIIDGAVKPEKEKQTRNRTTYTEQKECLSKEISDVYSANDCLAELVPFQGKLLQVVSERKKELIILENDLKLSFKRIRDLSGLLGYDRE